MNNFKICPNCSFVWENRANFMNDNNISIIGYQADFKRMNAGLFLFNHSCDGTLALEVNEFKDLYDGPVYQNRVTGTEDCPDYCLNKKMLDPCPNECEYALVREIIQKLKK